MLEYMFGLILMLIIGVFIVGAGVFLVQILFGYLVDIADRITGREK